MRIIAGNLRGRRLNPPQTLPVRPTTDMARESLFNILNNYIDYEDCSVLDLFAGTGAVSFEFVSRGAREVTAIDINVKCTEFIMKTAADFNVRNIHVVRADVFNLLKRANHKFDVVFSDPPYALDDLPALPDLVFDSHILSDNGIFILEHPRDFSFAEHPHFWQHRAYGKVNFSFFAMEVDQNDNDN